MAVLPAPEKQETLTPGVAADAWYSASSPSQSAGRTRRQGGISPRTRSVLDWLTVAGCVYVLIAAVGIIGSGFSLAVGDQAAELFSFASNPLVGLMIGVVATALIQSSTTTTATTVGLVAGGLPLEIAVPIILGANIGTTLTNTLVSFAMVRDREQFRRGFAAATVHDMFNLLAVVIFVPLEMMFGLLERLATAGAGALSGADAGVVADVFGGVGSLVNGATTPLTYLVGAGAGWLPGVWAGVVMIVVGIVMILAVITLIGRKLKALLVGRAQQILHTAMGRGPLSSIGSGFLVTAMVQSSTTATSLMVPLAGSGALTLRQIYPFTLGANIGTTLTALIASFAFDGELATIALTAGLVHFIYNVLAVALIFGLPGLRYLPVRGAQWLADLATRRKLYAVAWVLGVFLALPLTLIVLL